MATSAQEFKSPLLSLGISSILAAAIHAESDPIAEFACADQYVAYARLDPSIHDSGDTLHRRGKISKRGSPVLRHSLYLAAFVVNRQSSLAWAAAKIRCRAEPNCGPHPVRRSAALATTGLPLLNH